MEQARLMAEPVHHTRIDKWTSHLVGKCGHKFVEKKPALDTLDNHLAKRLPEWVLLLAAYSI